METMTVKEVLDETKKMMGNIAVPMNLIEQIGVPLARCINNITQCIDAMDKAEKKAEENTETVAQAE